LIADFPISVHRRDVFQGNLIFLA